MGITAKTVIKSLIPNLKHSLKENLKVFYQENRPPPQMEANLFLPATKVPPVPQSIQSGAELIDRDHIFYLDAAKELILPRI